MQVVIDIPDEIYKDIESRDWKNPIWARDSLMRYIHEGVILPKHHGRLIDADAFLKDNDDYTGWILCSSAWGGENGYKDTLEDLVADAPTIINADKEVQDADSD